MKTNKRQFWQRLFVGAIIVVLFVVLLGGVVLRAVWAYQRKHPALESNAASLESTIEIKLSGETEFTTVTQKEYNDTIQRVVAQGQKVLTVRDLVRDLFTNEEMTAVKPLLTRKQYNAAVAEVQALPWKEVSRVFETTLTKADQALTRREREAAEARRRAEEARRRAAELKAKRDKEVAAAWKILSVPYHSQSLQKIYNGCEAASLLMALQYKGYLKDVNLAKYAEMMPKSDDYNTGFVGSIYDLEPKTYVHWIAPGALAKFGRESSGANVVDVSGASLEALDKEVAAGNPVVIYVTFLFNPLKEWLNGAPKNLHVVLLTGYNSVSGTQRLTDPWTQGDGGRTWDVSRQELEAIYNAVGKRAVVVR